MSQLCIHGCGNLGIVQIYRQRRISWQCLKSSNSCPAVKERKKKICLERYGVSNPMKVPELKKKQIEKINFIERNKKLKETVRERYGVDNVFQRLDIREKISSKLASQTYESMQKKKATRIKNGFQIPDNQKSDWNLYRQKVNVVTRKSWREYKSFIENNHLERGRTKYHLDHIYSVYDGWLNNIDPQIIGHHCNLRLIYYKENCSKRVKSDITLEQLKENYDKYYLLRR